jgi:hypothetical protein
MVPGTIKIVWENSPHRGFHGTYRILFTDDGSRGSTPRQMSVLLKDFFVVDLFDLKMAWDRRRADADAWLRDLHEKEGPPFVLVLTPINITEELFESLRG